MKWNDHCIGHDSGIKRQIDISIKATIDSHCIFVIIQLKNWKRKADVKAVDEFASVVKDVKATSGILICRSGFTPHAKNYAKNIGIKLLNLHNAESKDWNQDITIPVLWLEYTIKTSDFKIPFHKTISENVTLHFGPKPKLLLSPNKGKSFIDLVKLFKDKWNNDEISKIPNTTHNLLLPPGLEIMGTTANGIRIWQPVYGIKISYRIKNKKSRLGYFKPKDCRGIIDYHNDDAFIASHLPLLDVIPNIPNKGWKIIENPDKIAVSIKGTFVTIENFDKIELSNMEISPPSKVEKNTTIHDV